MASTSPESKSKGFGGGLVGRPDAMSDEAVSVGMKVWVPDAAEVWQMGQVESYTESSVFVFVSTDPEAVEFPLSETHPFDPSHALDLDNIAKMNDMHEAPLLDMIRRRYKKDDIYTYTGDVLISLNPYKLIPLLYDLPAPQEDGGIGEDGSRPSMAHVLESPHVYAVADRAINSMKRAKVAAEAARTGGGRQVALSQSVIISGESGAGKTEGSKYVMRYLLNTAAVEAGQDMKDLSERIEAAMMKSNVILEAFGNAKTVRNDNSSRFGKYMKMQYDANRKIIGAKTEHFLLEKSRLVAVETKERNYHVFYQLCAGLASEAEGARLGLAGGAQSFRILSMGNCTTVNDVNDTDEYSALVDALGDLGLSGEEQTSVFELVACILLLGNIVFQGGGDGAIVEVVSPNGELERLCDLLRVPIGAMRNSMRTRNQKSGRGSTTSINLTRDQAEDNAKALIKYLYGELFAWLVRKINHTHSTVNSDADHGRTESFIGILDIFGFEIMQRNSFEQLCINFTNERLQQQFNHHVFALEQEEYIHEGIDWSVIQFGDNQHVLDLVEKKPQGLFVMLEDCAKVMARKPKNDALLQNYHNAHFNKHPAYSKPRFAGTEFIVKHFAGDVTYDITGFIEKNNDSLQEEVQMVFLISDHPFIQSLFGMPQPGALGFIPEPPPDLSAPPEAPGGRGSMAVRDSMAGRPSAALLAGSGVSGRRFAGAVTVSKVFRQQLEVLIRTLRATEPHYIKCIKPNSVKAAGGFSGALVTQQLRYSGVLEVVRIRREGYPLRVHFREFYRRYKILTHPLLMRKASIPEFPDAETCSRQEAKDASVFIATNGLPAENFQAGKHKLFMRDGSLEIIDSCVRQFYSKRAITVQTRVRTIQAKENLRMSLAAAVRLAAAGRMLVYRRRFRTDRARTVKLQSFVRTGLARKLFFKTLAAIRIQAHARGKIAITMHKKYMGARGLQTAARGFVARRQYARVGPACLLLACYARRFLAMRAFGKATRERDAATRFQAVVRSKQAREWYKRERRAFEGAQTHIASHVRARQATRAYRKDYATFVLCQVGMRGFLARKKFARVQTLDRLRRERERNRATRLQAHARMRHRRQEYQQKRTATTRIATVARGRAKWKEYRRQRAAATAVQSMSRRAFARHCYKRTLAARHLQSVHRMRTNYVHYKRTIAARSIQSGARRKAQRMEFLEQKARATKVQSRLRRFVATRKYERSLLATARVQLCVRAFLTARRLAKLTDVLFEAAAAGNVHKVSEMLAANPEMQYVRNRQDSHKTLLHAAACSGNISLATLLDPPPEMVADVDAEGNTPLHYACQRAHMDLVKFLATQLNGAISAGASAADLGPRPQAARRLTFTHRRGSAQRTQPTAGRAKFNFSSPNPFARWRSDEEEKKEDDSTFLHMGYLNKRRETDRFLKRWCKLTDSELWYMKKPSDSKPSKVIVLTQAMLKKSEAIDFCFEIHSPLLLDNRNKEGRLYFQAESEIELQKWYTKLRGVVGETQHRRERRRVPMEYLDVERRADLVKRTNKRGQTCLHMAATHDIDGRDGSAARVVQVAMWLVESGCDINRKADNGWSPLHVALESGNVDVAVALARKGADLSAVTNTGSSVLDMCPAEHVGLLMQGNYNVADRNALRPPPAKLCSSSYFSFLVEKVQVSSTSDMVDPYITCTVYDAKGHIVDESRDTHAPAIVRPDYVWWGCTFHMQVPMENLSVGSFVLMELKSRTQGDSGRGAIGAETLQWTRIPLNEQTINTGSESYEMYAMPVDITLTSCCGSDGFLHGDVYMTREEAPVADDGTRVVEDADERRRRREAGHLL